ncbi:zinc-ribbon domain-containing protein [Alteromonas oceanisediminis]|uniref:zinc-ribbon domain-containing protein n=1 Tax=Alteromonas oceanisediminis TaxID=2836180 RepID=UPI001BDA2B2C|nr:zinc-ribbon domain-containing protein [Alteromonas oceanisediminis]MBT0586545.1 hypothetical protein [Alteromonas oceanisediminis]
MALIDCPACNKKVSDKAQTCQHCGFAIGNASAEDVQRKLDMQRYKKKQSLQNQSMVAMLLFVTGFGLVYWGGDQPSDLQFNIAVGCSVFGFVWYIVNRVRLVILKRFS